LIKAYKALQGSGHNIWYRGKRRESGREKDLDIDEIQKKEELVVLPK